MDATFSPVVLIHQAIGAFFLPPLVLILLALAGLWCRRRLPVYLALAAFYLLATPAVSAWLTAPLEPPALSGPAALAGVDAIVVLGAGTRHAAEYGDAEPTQNALLRLHYAAFLARASGKPVLVTGGAPMGGESEGSVMARVLARDYGVRVRWIEARSHTTEENAHNSAAILLPAGARRIALVSNGWHLRRAGVLFARQGFTVLPAPTALTGSDNEPALVRWLPQGSAMQQSWSTLREWLGLAWAAR